MVHSCLPALSRQSIPHSDIWSHYTASNMHPPRLMAPQPLHKCRYMAWAPPIPDHREWPASQSYKWHILSQRPWGTHAAESAASRSEASAAVTDASGLLQHDVSKSLQPECIAFETCMHAEVTFQSVLEGLGVPKVQLEALFHKHTVGTWP